MSLTEELLGLGHLILEAAEEGLEQIGEEKRALLRYRSLYESVDHELALLEIVEQETHLRQFDKQLAHFYAALFKRV